MSNPDLQNAPASAPLVRRVSHHSIELSWDLETEPRTGPPEKWTSYSVEEMHPKTHVYDTIYIGYSTSYTVEGLEPNTSYTFRLKIMKPSGESYLSPAVAITTAREPPTGQSLHRAVSMNDEEEMKKVLATGTVNINVPDKLGFTPLMVAAQKGFYSLLNCVVLDHLSVRLVRILLEQGSNVNMTNSSGKSSLMLACFAGHLDIVQCLRSAGAAWTSVDAGGCTALHWATDGGHLEVLSYMIEDGCEVDTRDSRSRWTPLMRVSALSGSTSVASLLISAGADVNARDKDGKTPLMIAVLNNHEELVRLLLESGADVDVKNQFGSGAAEMAKAFGRESIISLFEQKIP